jgi:hypothetical protein
LDLNSKDKKLVKGIEVKIRKSKVNKLSALKAYKDQTVLSLLQFILVLLDTIVKTKIKAKEESVKNTSKQSIIRHNS